jgi:hypothetical protein
MGCPSVSTSEEFSGVELWVPSISGNLPVSRARGLSSACTVSFNPEPPSEVKGETEITD